MSISNRFNEIGGDSLMLTELVSLFNLSPEELDFADRFSKFQDVAQFFKGSNNYSYIIRKLSLNKNVDRLQHVWEWTQLHQEMNDATKMLEGEQSQLSQLGISDEMLGEIQDPMLLVQYESRKNSVDKLIDRVKSLQDEMKLYE